MEFEHEGNIVKIAGDGVFLVADRESWYPRGSVTGATFDVTFRYPKRLTLVNAGEPVSDKTEGDWRTTRRRIAVPVGAVGFDLGDYEKVSTVASGISIDVYGNRHLQDSLKPAADVMQPQPFPGARRGRGPQSQLGTTIPAAQLAPDPLGRLKAVAADVSSAVDFYSGLFGPPALKTLTIAPIPGTFGQGFPGLVYLSTFAYLDPRERPAAMRSARQQVFYSDMLAAHETAHQWWGAVISVDRSEDGWLLESLANYSALLWLEKKRGFKEALSVLQGYRDELLTESDGRKTPESAGPIVWGDRLLASDIPGAWQAITYGKGVWILHMLRRRMGDERFLAMLAEFRKRYEFRTVTTEGFKALVQEFRPRGLGAEAVDTFFDNWIYATGVPSLKLNYTVTGTAPSIALSGTLEQSGVEEDFSVDVPVEIQFAKGPSQTLWVRTSTGEESFSEKLRQQPVKVALPDDILLKH
jgi:aminopeptidase N